MAVYIAVTSTESIPGAEVGAGFTEFFASVEPRLRRALMATYGPEAGREAAADALAWAWEHQDRLEKIASPVAYLYRVGQSRMRRRKVRLPFVRNDWAEPRVEPRLAAALQRLTARQRVAVVLVHGYGWTLAEVAELTGTRVTTVQTHLERGLHHLRKALEVENDA